MGKSAKRHRRKVRRKWKAIQRHGRSAGPKHKGRSGRTGHMHAKKLMTLQDAKERVSDGK